MRFCELFLKILGKAAAVLNRRIMSSTSCCSLFVKFNEFSEDMCFSQVLVTVIALLALME